MNSLKVLWGLLLLLTLSTSCTGSDENLREMIPSDATGVISVNLPQLLEKAGMVKDRQISIPEQLATVIEGNSNSLFCRLMSDLPQSGIDLKTNVYSFFSQGIFRFVTLIALDNADVAKLLVQQRTGIKFKSVNGVEFLLYKNWSVVIDDDVLFIGMESHIADEGNLASAAHAIISKKNKSITDVDDIMKCIEQESDINAYFDVKGFAALLKSLPGFKNVADRFPVISIFTDSDIKAFSYQVNFEKEGATLLAQIKADKNSDFITLLNTTLAKPDNEFLKAMPTTMKYVFAMSVKGSQFARLDQIKKSVNLLSNLPGLDKLDIRGIINTIDGPLAIGLSPCYMYSDDASPNFADDWNIAIAVKSNNPEFVTKSVRDFAEQKGQTDWIKDGRHVYNYGGKPVYFGTEGNVVYALRLDHELTEPFLYEQGDVKERFANCRLGFYIQADAGASQGMLNFGFKNNTEGDGIFYTVNPQDNPVLTFLEILCSITPSQVPDESDYIEHYDF